MKLKMLVHKNLLPNLFLLKGKTYEVDEIIQDSYRIKIPMKQKNKFRYALVKDEEGELID